MAAIKMCVQAHVYYNPHTGTQTHTQLLLELTVEK